MNIIYTKSYDKTYKKLKNHREAKERLKKIIDYLEAKETFDSMINDPLAKMYNLEKLKYYDDNYYSFRLSKVIRLIIRKCGLNIEVELVYISLKHYDDFDESRVIYYDE